MMNQAGVAGLATGQAEIDFGIIADVEALAQACDSCVIAHH